MQDLPYRKRKKNGLVGWGTRQAKNTQAKPHPVMFQLLQHAFVGNTLTELVKVQCQLSTFCTFHVFASVSSMTMFARPLKASCIWVKDF